MAPFTVVCAPPSKLADAEPLADNCTSAFIFTFIPFIATSPAEDWILTPWFPFSVKFWDASIFISLSQTHIFW